MSIPQNQLTLDSTVFPNRIISAVITRLENGFDTATIEVPDTNSLLYPDTVTNGTAIQFDVKDSKTASYTTIFKGITRFLILPYGNNEIIQLKCDGLGYGFGDTVVLNEYGSQSFNPTLDTITEIITDATSGILAKYVNAILKGSPSGFNYSSVIANINDVIKYILFPYKPAIACLNDLCDLVTALKAGSAGPHWIVTTDNTLRLKLVDQSGTGWTKYYGDSQANSTLQQGIDFTDYQFEPMGSEANHIIYNGIWRRPSLGDWTEGNASSWDDGSGGTFTDESTIKSMGSYSVKSYNAAATGCGFKFTFPDAINLNNFTRQNLASINFDLATDRVMTPLSGAGIYNNFFLRLFSDVAAYDYILPGDSSISKGTTAGDQNFQHFSFQVGKYSKDQWQHSATSLDWSNILSTEIWCPNVQSAYLDAFNFGGAQVTRIAKNSTNITANKVKTKVITDVTPKDDTLTSGTPGTTDTGLMAQLAYSELLRLQKSSIVGTVTVRMISDALPGQWFHIHAKKKLDGSYGIDKDMRATKITHTINTTGYFTTIDLTDDLTNSHARPAYEDRNKIAAANRPDFQDRQATSLKAGNVDIWVTPLTEDYPS
jgi:hypothetical protein